MAAQSEAHWLTAEAEARIRGHLDRLHAYKREWEAREPERQRLKIESHRAVERLHRAVVALKAARLYV